MVYEAEISRANPSCFLFLLDQSGSMQDAWSGTTKAQGVADAINRILQNLIIRCTSGESVLDRFSIGVIGYGARVDFALNSSLAGRKLIPISEIADVPRIETRQKKFPDGAGGIVEQSVTFPVWFDPVASGSTPMSQAFDLAAQTLKEWLMQYPDSFPPIVINLTDGEPDKDPSRHAEQLRNVRSNDGGVLLFNIHISSKDAGKIEFPDTDAKLPDNYARQLFTMSSLLPDRMRDLAKPDYDFPLNTRGFVFNADLVGLVNFLDIGTRAAQR